MEWMILPLKRYAQFSGRSRRKEFWLYILFVFLVTIVLTILDRALGLGGGSPFQASDQIASGSASYQAGYRASGGVLTAIFGLATLIPSLAVSVRRLHDIDRTGWWILTPAIPYVLGLVILFAGAASQSPALMGLGGIVSFLGLILMIVLLVFYCLPGTKGPNRFGDDPLGHSSDDLARTFE